MIDDEPNRLGVLNRVSVAVNGSASAQDVIDNAVQATLASTGLTCGVVYWLDKEQERLIGRGARGFRYGLTRGIDVHSKRSYSLPSRALRASEPLVFDVANRRTGYDMVTERERRCIVPEGIRTAAFVKIGSRNSPFGVLALCAHGSSWHFDDAWMELFSMVSEQIGAGLDRAESSEAVAQRAADLAVLHEFACRLDTLGERSPLPGALDFARRALGFTRCTVEGSEPVGDGGSVDEIAVPLLVGDLGLGLLRIVCGSTVGARERWLAKAMAELVSVAIWRDRFYRDRNRAAAGRLCSGMARDLHDGLAQRFYIIQLNLSAAAAAAGEPESVRRHLDQALHNARLGVEESRRWVRRLREPPLPGRLREELTALGEEFAGNFDVPCDVNIVGREVGLEPSVQHALRTAVQELLHNVGKHADATQALVDAQFGRAQLTVTVTDDGCGIDTTSSGGFGLLGIRERMSEVGAEFSISGRPGEGTVASLVVPLAPPVPALPVEPALVLN